MQSTVLISGADSGMGLATALLLAERGFDVYGGARSAEGMTTIEPGRGGVIVNVGSFLGQIGLPLLTHYNASKYAVEGITDSLRLELAPFGVRVHTVAPGLFRTRFAARRSIRESGSRYSRAK